MPRERKPNDTPWVTKLIAHFMLHVFFLYKYSGEFLNETGEAIIDEEEYELIAKLQELKGSYRTDYDQWKNLKSEINYCQNLVNQCQNRLLQGKVNIFIRIFNRTLSFRI